MANHLINHHREIQIENYPRLKEYDSISEELHMSRKEAALTKKELEKAVHLIDSYQVKDMTFSHHKGKSVALGFPGVVDLNL